MKASIDNRKKFLNSNISSTCPHSMANFGSLTAEIGSGVWGTPANFNGFRVLPSLLQRQRSSEANQTLHHAWPSPALVHGTLYTHFRGLLFPDGILSGTKFTLRPSIAFSYIGSVTAQHSSSGHQPCGVVQGMQLRNFRRGRHLYSAGRPSCLAPAHILVMAALRSRCGHYTP